MCAFTEEFNARPIFVIHDDNDPPFYVILDEAYNRMLKKLQNGKKYEKSYNGVCPHKNTNDCKCPFYLNFLKDGRMVRVVNGVIKPVLKYSDLDRVTVIRVVGDSQN